MFAHRACRGTSRCLMRDAETSPALQPQAKLTDAPQDPDGPRHCAAGQLSETLIDRTTLEAGGNWRSTINTWLAICDAALILIHPDSVKSQFCQYEWAVLSHRRDMQEKFLVIPIFLHVKPNDIALRPEQLSAISGYFEFDELDVVIGKVKNQLARLVLEKQPGMLISYVASALQGAILREDAIEIEAGKLDLDSAVGISLPTNGASSRSN